MIKVIAIEGKDDQKVIREYYTNPDTLCKAIEALFVYEAKTPYFFGVAYLEIDGFIMCNDEIKEYCDENNPTIEICKSILLAKAEAGMKMKRIGHVDVWEDHEINVDKGFLYGFLDGKKTEDNPCYNQGFQSGTKCRVKRR